MITFTHQGGCDETLMVPAAVAGSVQGFNHLLLGGEMSYRKDIPTYDVWSNELGVVWEDLRVALELTRRGAANQPGFGQVLDDGSGSVGVYATLFDKATREDVFFSVQFPHAWKIGSTIEPHVHWMPTDTDTGTVRWGLEYTWVDINGTFSNTTIIYAEDAADGTASKHQYASFAGVTPPVGITGVSSMMLCRLFRDAAHANDTYDNDAAGLEFDIHYQKDAVGSRSMLSKG